MLKYCESFDHIAAKNLIPLGWTVQQQKLDCGMFAITDGGRRGTKRLNFIYNAYSYSDYTYFTLPRLSTRLVLGFAYTRWTSRFYDPPVSLSGNEIRLYFCSDTYVNFRVKFVLSNTGLTFGFCTGESGTGYPAIPDSRYVSVPFIQKDAYTFIEMMVDVADYKNGRVKLAVNGEVVHDATGIITAAYSGFGDNPLDSRAKLNVIRFGDGYAYNGMSIDSLYICDDQGGYQNDFLGDIFVHTIYPSNDGDRSEFQPYVNGLPASESIPRVTLIDDAIFDSSIETEYIEADWDLLQQMMLYEEDIPGGVEIIAVNHRTAARGVASPGTPPPSTLVPLFQPLGGEAIVINSLAKRFTGWAYQYLDVYHTLVPGLAVPWTELMLHESQYGFLAREGGWNGLCLETLMLEDLAGTWHPEYFTIDERLGMDDASSDGSWFDVLDEIFCMDDGADEGNLFVEDGAGLVDVLSGALFQPQHPGALLHFEGADGSTTFTDVGGGSWSRIAAEIDTAQKKFGNASGLFNGSNAYIYASINNCIFGTGDFTIDFWMMRNGSNSGWTSILSVGGYSGVSLRFPPAEPCGINLAADSSARQSSAHIDQDTWYHVAVVRASGLLKLYLNGVAQGSAPTVTKNFTGNTVRVGKDPQDIYYFRGWIDELRIIKGVALWTADFTPPDSECHPGCLIYDWDVTETQLGILDEVLDE